MLSRLPAWPLLLSLALGGCCSLEPPPPWAASPPAEAAGTIQARGEAHEAASPEAALAAATRAAAERVALRLAGGAAEPQALERLRARALQTGTTLERFVQGCETHEAWVLISWPEAELQAAAQIAEREARGDARDPERLRRAGRAELAAGRPAEAAQSFRLLTRELPGDADAHLGLAEALRTDLARTGVARAPGATETLTQEARRAYERALELSAPGSPLRPQATQGLADLGAADARRWQARFEELVVRVRSGKRDPREALAALVQAVDPSLGPSERSFLEERALEVMACALVGPLREALPSGARVAVLAPEWPREAAPDPGAARALERLAVSLGAALSAERFAIVATDEVRSRAEAAGLAPPRHGDLADPARRAALAEALDATHFLVLIGGQQATARALEASSGRALSPQARVYHPRGDAWADVGQEGAPIAAEVALLGQRLSARGKLEQDLRVEDGAELRTGDQLQLVVRLPEPAYVYAIWFDSLGKTWLLCPETRKLFPSADPAPNRKRPAGELRVPGHDLFFTLDESLGLESIYVVVSREPLQALDALVADLNGQQDPSGALRRRLEGYAGRVLAVEAGREPAGVVLRGRDVLARQLWFQHVPR